jgi:LCP family protein required for cell wall assembly
MAEDPDRPRYTLYRSRRGLLDRLRRREEAPDRHGLGDLRDVRRRRRLRRERPRKPWTLGRVLRYVALAVGAWLALSLVLFLVSAQIERGKVADAAERSLDGGGFLLTSPSTVLVLGSDARPRGTGEGGANVVGQPSRSDTIMLLRTGGGAGAKLSIPRDTVVDIPGHGPDKANAAYAIGGPALAITTIEGYLGIEVDHLIEVDFENFPDFVDALGGVDVELPGCVRAELDGGDDAGGTTLDLRRGKNRLDGRRALALARVRRNGCDSSEDDRDRAARQQLILTAIKDRLVSPGTFLRLPWVSWSAPKAIRTDMSGFTLLQLFAAIQMSGSPPPRVLEPSGFATTPGGGSGLAVSEDERRSEVRRFLEG